MYQYRVYDPKILKQMKASAIGDEEKAKKRIKYRDDVMAGKIEQSPRGSKLKKMKEWAEKNHIEYATCPKCKKPMSKKMADAQVENKREGGVECMACIMGRPRRKDA